PLALVRRLNAVPCRRPIGAFAAATRTGLARSFGEVRARAAPLLLRAGGDRGVVPYRFGRAAARPLTAVAFAPSAADARRLLAAFFDTLQGCPSTPGEPMGSTLPISHIRPYM